VKKKYKAEWVISGYADGRTIERKAATAQRARSIARWFLKRNPDQYVAVWRYSVLDEALNRSSRLDAAYGFPEIRGRRRNFNIELKDGWGTPWNGKT
jgi:hypothetical protein